MFDIKKISAFALSAFMAFAPTAVMAAGKAPVVTGDTPVVTNMTEITKHLEVAEGTTLPDLTFEFDFEATAPAEAPAITPVSVSYSNKDMETASFDATGKAVLEKKVNYTMPTFPHAGVYTYTLTEKGATTTTGEVINDTNSYTLNIYVENKDNGLHVAAVDAKGNNGQKVNSILFTNQYVSTSDLIINKTVEGAYGDLTKDFTFTLTFTKSPVTNVTDTKVIGTYVNKDQMTTNIEFNYGEAKTFTLKHGELLSFQTLPVGTRYVLSENGETGYTPSVAVVEGTTQFTKNAKQNESLSATQDGKKDNVIHTGTNTVHYTNTYKEITPTGIFMNNLPFMAMFAIGAGALVLLALTKRKHASER